MVKSHMAGARFFKWFFEQAASGAGSLLEHPEVQLLGQRLGSHDALWTYFASENFSDSTGIDACCQENSQRSPRRSLPISRELPRRPIFYTAR